MSPSLVPEEGLVLKIIDVSARYDRDSVDRGSVSHKGNVDTCIDDNGNNNGML